jgi:hypothetical protein
MLVKEKIKREMDQFFTVRLDEDEIKYLENMMDDWATDPHVGKQLYADLRMAVGAEMKINRMEARAITDCLEAEEHWGPLYQKFITVFKEAVLPS